MLNFRKITAAILAMAIVIVFILPTAANAATVDKEWLFGYYAGFGATIVTDPAEVTFTDGRFAIPVLHNVACVYNANTVVRYVEMEFDDDGQPIAEIARALALPAYTCHHPDDRVREAKFRFRVYAADDKLLESIAGAIQFGFSAAIDGKVVCATGAKSACRKWVNPDGLSFYESQWVSIDVLQPKSAVKIYPSVWATADPAVGGDEFFIVIDVGFPVLHIKPSDIPPDGNELS